MLPKNITLLYSCSVLILVVYTLLLIFNYALLPETIAIHRDISGTIDGYGGKLFLKNLKLRTFQTKDA